MSGDVWELARLDGIAQAGLARRGEATPRELAEAALARIDELDGELHAVVWRAHDLERQLALLGDTREHASPLAGAPALLKDTGASYAGAPRWHGSRFHAPGVDEADSVLVARMRAAGLVILGKSSGSELGNANETTFPGPTNNPWALERSTGGSSAGSAAAVAAGLVPIGHASDGGGSIRWPAAWCGLFGLKPTRARNPLVPGGEGPAGIVVAHCVTRSVRDSAAMLDALNGWAAGQQHVAPPAAASYLREAEHDPPRLRVGYSLGSPSGSRVDAACREAVAAAAQLLAELGHEVEEAAPAYDAQALVEGFEGITFDANAAALDGLAQVVGRPAQEGDLEPLTWWLAARGRTRSASDHLRSVSALADVASDAVRFFAERDVFLCPTNPTPPPPHALLVATRETVEEVWAREIGGGIFCLLANVSGLPAMSVPLSATAEGLPIGCHFLGPFGREDLLLRLAGQLERARPWADRWPPLVPVAERHTT
jgi:amidase